MRGPRRKNLSALPGVLDVSVNLASEQAHLKLSSPNHLQDAAQALDTLGYPARKVRITLNIASMSCASCVGRGQTRRSQMCWVCCQSLVVLPRKPPWSNTSRVPSHLPVRSDCCDVRILDIRLRSQSARMQASHASSARLTKRKRCAAMFFWRLL